MSKLEKFGLFFMLLGISSFRDSGWAGGVGVLFLMAGWLMFNFPAESAPNTRLQSDGLCRCGLDNVKPPKDICKKCGLPYPPAAKA